MELRLGGNGIGLTRCCLLIGPGEMPLSLQTGLALAIHRAPPTVKLAQRSHFYRLALSRMLWSTLKHSELGPFLSMDGLPIMAQLQARG